MNTQFVFVTCQVGAERALKEELQQRWPHLHSAYARPGFITLKETRDRVVVTPEIELGAVFARAYGACLGRIVDVDVIAEQRAQVTAERIKSYGQGAVVQIWLRDTAAPGEMPSDDRVHEYERLAAELGALALTVEAAPKPGQLVFDVVVVEDDEWWLGVHMHSIDHPPCGAALKQPPDAPSRAYLKVEEAIRWFDLPLRDGDVALELGAAPGGVVYALLMRGLKVTGVDPGQMADVVRNDRRFKHLAMSAFDIRENDLPKRVDWLLLDMNTEPELALRAVEHVKRLGRVPACGVILTLKLNQPSFSARIPGLVQRVKSVMGYKQVYAKQLTNNRREITLVGLADNARARR